MPLKLTVPLSVEETRDRFYTEMVLRRGGSVGLEMGLAGYVDARRRFVLAVQGWEKNLWMRPLLTRLEGFFQRSPENTTTTLVFERRGLALPIFILSLLLPYTAARYVVTDWPPTTYDWLVVGGTLVFVIIATLMLMIVERRTHKLLILGLQTIYGSASVEK
jgi:hypothetical protein